MRVSIRFQIVALVSVLLMGAMAVYVYLAATLISRDKLAWIYDQNSLLAGTLSEELRANLSSLVDKLLYLGEQSEAAAGGRSGEDSEERAVRALFSTDIDVLSLEVWRRRGEATAGRTEAAGTYSRAFRFADDERLASLNLSRQDLEEARKQVPVPFEVVAAERVLLQNASFAPDVAIVRVSAATADKRLVVIADLRPDRLLRVFGRSSYHEVYLVDGRGGILVHPDPNKMIGRADVGGLPIIRDALDGKLARGAREFSLEGKGDIIGAFSRVDLGRLAVIIEAPKSEAMRASVELVRRTALFALGVVSLALLVSIYFSRRLAAPLRKLEETMQRISRGEFGVKVPVTSRNEIGSLASAFNRMSHELSEREHALMEKNAQLIQSEKLSALGELSAGLAHEVKNPMVGIVGFSQLGLEATSMDEAREYFELIEADAQRANGILQNLLEFARPQHVDLQRLEANHVVSGSLRLVSHQLQIKGVALHTDLAETLPEVMGDSNQLRQVLLNLMMNAAQAMENAPVKQLFVSTFQEPGWVVIEVRDTGPGMTEEVRRKLFRPFFSTKPKGKGTGLGLSVSSSIIAHHKGEIRVESSPGQGAAFTIRLPALPEEVTEPALRMPTNAERRG